MCTFYYKTGQKCQKCTISAHEMRCAPICSYVPFLLPIKLENCATPSVPFNFNIAHQIFFAKLISIMVELMNYAEIISEIMFSN